MKLAEIGILWIEDSEMYIADYSLYKTAAEFLRDVLNHIYNTASDNCECGWFENPKFEDYLPFVTTTFMAHRLGQGDESLKWWMQEEKGRGNRKVWCIDFDQTPRLLT